MKRTIKGAILAALLAGTALAAVPVMAQQAGNGPQAGQQQGLRAQDGSGPNGIGPNGAGAQAGGAMPRFFERYDADGDGAVSAEELKAGRTAEAAALDANGDGKLSAEELVAADLRRVQARGEARVAAQIAAQDLDGDGMLSAAELAMPGAGGRMFDRLDRDDDGMLSADEAQAMQARMFDRMGRGMGGDDRGRGMRGDHGSRWGDCDRRGAGMMQGQGMMGRPGQGQGQMPPMGQGQMGQAPNGQGPQDGSGWGRILNGN